MTCIKQHMDLQVFFPDAPQPQSPPATGAAASPAVANGLPPIDRLREICRRLLADAPLDRDDAEWLGCAVERFLSRANRSLEEGLGLIFPQGGVPWWREEGIRKRDAALREMAERFYAEYSPTAQARRIAIVANRYAASAWRFDRDDEEMPERHRGTVMEWLWHAFKSQATMPICERQLRNVLGR